MTYSGEETRKQDIKRLGLPEDATWEDITARNNEEARKQYIKRLGLPEDATWEDISAHRLQRA